MKCNKKKKSQCASCTINGYSPEVCKLHHKQQVKKSVSREDGPKPLWRQWSAKALIGAGVGAGGAMAGIAVAPIFGVKALFGHVIATKIACGAAGAGAGSNVAIQAGRKANARKTIRCRDKKYGNELLRKRIIMRRR